MTPDILLQDITRRCPTIDATIAYRLAEVWTTLHNQIIDRMFDIVESELGLVLHIEQRSEAVFELVKLSHFLQTILMDKKTKEKPLDQYDPVDEAALLNTIEEQNKINNTARNMADGVWKPLTAQWRTKRPLIDLPQQRNTSTKLLKPTKIDFRRQMHYVPQSTTRQWTDRSSGKFVKYTIGVDGEVRAQPSTAKAWGVGTFLYTQNLEHLLGMVEGDARRAYKRLVDIVPLNGDDTRRWIAFIITQYIRTPRFIRTMLPHSKAFIERSGLSYPTDPAHLGRAFETLFRNNDFYAAFYKLITARTWQVAKTADGLTFLKGDNPVVVTGNHMAGSWRLLYPLTPQKCFIAGPELNKEPHRIIPHQIRLSDEATLVLNAEICTHAETSVIGVRVPDRIDARPTIRGHLRKTFAGDYPDMPFWGLSGITSSVTET